MSYSGNHGAPDMANPMISAYLLMLKNAEPARYSADWGKKDPFSYASSAVGRYPAIADSILGDRYAPGLSMRDIGRMPTLYESRRGFTMREVESMPVLWQSPDSNLRAPAVTLTDVVNSILLVKK
jgi:hypothetical protein